MPLCHNCGTEADETAKFCKECGGLLKEKRVASVSMKAGEAGPKYTAMQLGESVMRIVGWVVIIGGCVVSVVMGAIVAISNDGSEADGVWIAIGGVIGSLVYGILSLAAADLYHKIRNL